MRTTLLILTLMMAINANSQFRRNPNRTPIAQQPTEKDMERQKQKMEERLEEYINTFLTTLEAGEFQQVIIKQHIDSYFDEKEKIFSTEYSRVVERMDAIKKLDSTHFKELKGVVSESDMEKIQELIKGDFDEKEVIREKKKKRKRKRKNKN
jgi:hypothetical protein